MLVFPIVRLFKKILGISSPSYISRHFDRRLCCNRRSFYRKPVNYKTNFTIRSKKKCVKRSIGNNGRNSTAKITWFNSCWWFVSVRWIRDFENPSLKINSARPFSMGLVILHIFDVIPTYRNNPPNNGRAFVSRLRQWSRGHQVVTPMAKTRTLRPLGVSKWKNLKTSHTSSLGRHLTVFSENVYPSRDVTRQKLFPWILNAKLLFRSTVKRVQRS